MGEPPLRDSVPTNMDRVYEQIGTVFDCKNVIDYNL